LSEEILHLTSLIRPDEYKNQENIHDGFPLKFQKYMTLAEIFLNFYKFDFFRF